MRVRFQLFLFLFGLQVSSFGQSVYAPLEADYLHFLDRLDIMSGRNTVLGNTSIKPFLRITITSALTENSELFLNSKADNFNMAYLHRDNPEWSQIVERKEREGKLNWIYPSKNAFIRPAISDGELQINPVLHFQFSGPEDGHWGFINQRGLEVRGHLGGKLGFYSAISENQRSFHSQAVAFENEPLGIGFRKTYVPSNRLLNPDSSRVGLDYFLARGYISWQPIKQVQMQFGNDRNFIGNGLESFILSEHSPDALNLKIHSKLWKFNYLNLFSELNHLEGIRGMGGGFQPKYSAFHYLGFDLLENLSIGLFEHVLFARDSSEAQGYKLAYMNPVIFYRAVEHNQNSADNVIVGLDWKWNFLKKFSFYGQFVLDEFKKDELFARNGWWANKWALQAGIKGLNLAGVSNLDWQAEFNTARPYTFQHFEPEQNYMHFGQPLGHSSGANFREFRFLLKYQPFQRWIVECFMLNRLKGYDPDENSNYGGDLRKNYMNRSSGEYQNRILQGKLGHDQIIALNMTYMPYHNLFFDLGGRINRGNLIENGGFIYFGMRLNAIASRYNRF